MAIAVGSAGSAWLPREAAALASNASCALHVRTVDVPPSKRSRERGVIRSNILYLVLGALVVVVAVLSYQLYQVRKQPEGMRIQ